MRRKYHRITRAQDGDSTDDGDDLSEPLHGEEGLGTGLLPHWNTAPYNDSPCSDDGESMLAELESWVLSELRRGPAGGRWYSRPSMDATAHGHTSGYIGGPKRPPMRTRRIHRLRKSLREHPELIVMKTDKTGRYVVQPTADYYRWMLEHMASDAVEVPTSDLVVAHDQALDFIENDLSDVLSDKEVQYLRQKVMTKRVATPKLFLKDHQAPRADGSFKTRLVVPADGFMAGFGKMAYLGIKGILDDLGVGYADRQVSQAYALKRKIERNGYRRDNVTIASLDISKMYPSIRFSIIEDAVTFFTRGAPREMKDRAAVCLEMLQFGMERTYLQFGDKYYQYEGEGVPGDPGLTIGGYESAWLADLGLAYLLQQVPSIVNRMEFLEFYRDDGLVVFDGKVTKQYVHNWLETISVKN